MGCVFTCDQLLHVFTVNAREASPCVMFVLLAMMKPFGGIGSIFTSRVIFVCKIVGKVQLCPYTHTSLAKITQTSFFMFCSSVSFIFILR